jgi:hypothetical protein
MTKAVSFGPALHAIDLFFRMSYGVVFFMAVNNRFWAGCPEHIFLPVNIAYKVKQL